jgi:hypothetical protein
MEGHVFLVDETAETPSLAGIRTSVVVLQRKVGDARAPTLQHSDVERVKVARHEPGGIRIDL